MADKITFLISSERVRVRHMGYYSEVAIKAEEKAYSRLREIFTQEELHVTPTKVRKDDEDNYIITWDFIEWLSTYRGIKKIGDVLDGLDKEHLYGSNDQLGYAFLRLGEETEDIEERSNEDLELTMYIGGLQ